MTKLETLYASIKGLQELGLPLNEETLKAADDLEEQLIKSEILPSLSENIEPILREIQRDLVLVVEYHPGEQINVALSRKVKISDFSDAKPLTPVISQPISGGRREVEPHEPKYHIENPTKGLKVTFMDGTVICNNTAISTFIDALRKIGLDRIPVVGIKRQGYNLVGHVKRPPEAGHIWQHEVEGWYVYSNIGNKRKKKCLQQISDYYKLNLKIEDGKPE